MPIDYGQGTSTEVIVGASYQKNSRSKTSCRVLPDFIGPVMSFVFILLRVSLPF